LKALEILLRVDLVEVANVVANPRQLVLKVAVPGEDVCLSDRRASPRIAAEGFLADCVMFGLWLTLETRLCSVVRGAGILEEAVSAVTVDAELGLQYPTRAVGSALQSRSQQNAEQRCREAHASNDHG
jgi:hypothetical protein